MAPRRILVINPNSNASVTSGLEDALSAWRDHSGIVIECMTLADGPFGIETDEHIREVTPLVARTIETRDDCDAYVIGCYSDPGLRESRARVSRPIFGMQQSAVTTAIATGGRYGVLAMSERSIERHLDYLAKIGLRDHLAAEVPLNISVDAAANDPATYAIARAAGRRLVDQHGADVLILGCAGMARHRARLQEDVGRPVIDPVQAAVALAVGALQ